jgi:TP53 regulating kinase-like protein
LRTRREAEAILRALESGARVPKILAIYPSLGLLIIEYVEGPTLKTYIDQNGISEDLLLEAGRILGLVHRAGVVHGDPTTSNYIVSKKGLYLVDFGLAELKSDIESRAVDIHLFRRAVESTHTGLAVKAFDLFKRGYIDVMNKDGEEILRRAEEIRLRGRYVEARRKTVWRGVESESP